MTRDKLVLGWCGGGEQTATSTAGAGDSSNNNSSSGQSTTDSRMGSWWCRTGTDTIGNMMIVMMVSYSLCLVTAQQDCLMSQHNNNYKNYSDYKLVNTRSSLDKDLIKFLSDSKIDTNMVH